MTAPAAMLGYADPEIAAPSLDGPMSNAELDALASEICRLIGETQAELARYNEAEAAEIARIQLRYGNMRGPLERRVAQLEEMGRECARRADFGKKKSRSVGNGTYGKRQVPESVKVADQESALLWLDDEKQSAAIREKTVRSVDVKEAKPIVLAHLISTGELPPGFEHVEPHDEFFVKVEL